MNFILNNAVIINFLFIVVFAIMAIPFTIFVLKRMKKNQEKIISNLKMVADHFGFKFTAAISETDMDTMEGVFNGAYFKITMKESGSSKNSTVYTKIYAPFKKTLNAGLQISREGFLLKIVKMIGVKDIQTGNPEFDKKFIIQGKSEAILIPMLSRTNVQTAITELFNFKNYYTEINDKGVTMECMGILQSIEKYEEPLRLISNTIKAFEK